MHSAMNRKQHNKAPLFSMNPTENLIVKMKYALKLMLDEGECGITIHATRYILLRYHS